MEEGSVSRGAPIDRAIVAEPRNNGTLRLTDKASCYSKYAIIGGRHPVRTSFVVSFTSFYSAECFSCRSKAKTLWSAFKFKPTSYLNLVNHSDFVSYFNQASPVDELSSLKIGSDSVRFGVSSLSDLRAIPWFLHGPK